MPKAPANWVWIFNAVLGAILVWMVIHRSGDSMSAHNAAETHLLEDSGLPGASHSLGPHASTPHSSRSGLAHRILSTHWQSLGNLAHEFLQSYDLETEEGKEALRKVIAQVASQNPAHALDLLGYFPPKSEVHSLESKVLSDWIQHDTQRVLEHFRTRSDFCHERHLAALVKTFANRSNEDLEDFMSWLSELSDPVDKSTETQRKDHFLQGAIASHFVEHLPVAQSPKALEVFLQNISNPALNAQLTQVLPRYGDQFPEQAMAWLTEHRDTLPYETYLTTLDNLLDQWGSGKNPDLASDFLSREDFYTVVYRPKDISLSAEQREQDMIQFFDQRLRSFIEASVGYHPVDAYFNADLFHDPALKQQYFDRAAMMIKEFQAEPDPP